MQLGLYAAIIALLYVGGDLISTGEAKVGQITGLLTFTLQLLNALLMLAQLLIMLSRTIASGDRIVELLDTESEFSAPLTSTKVPTDNTLHVQNVSFAYEEGAKNVLNNISFTLEPQKTLGIIGQTGSGKSTLVHLLARLYDLEQGSVRLGDVNIKDLSKHDLLQTVNVVFQSNMLFSGSILDNLHWGNNAPSEPELSKALSASLADEIVEKLPHGLASEVGQAGQNLSGGQKQRIALARALLRNPKILILDDSLNAIDTINENKIRTNLRKYYPDLTLIIVSQRISTIKDAESIIVLHEGHVNGHGNHNELLENNAIYRDIYETQLQGAAL